MGSRSAPCEAPACNVIGAGSGDDPGSLLTDRKEPRRSQSGAKFAWADVIDSDDEYGCMCCSTCNDTGPDGGGRPAGLSTSFGSYPATAKIATDIAVVTSFGQAARPPERKCRW